MTERFWLSDAQWAAIEPLLPHLGGKPRVDDRRVISGILHRFREGLRWRAIPAEYGPRTTLFNRFDRWSERGLWQKLLARLASCSEPPDVATLVGRSSSRRQSPLTTARRASTSRCQPWATRITSASTGVTVLSGPGPRRTMSGPTPPIAQRRTKSTSPKTA